MRDKRRDLSPDFSAPPGASRPGLPPTRGHLQPSGRNGDRNLEVGNDGYQPGRSFYIDEFRVPTSLEGGVMVDGAARSWSSRGIGVVRVLTTIAVAAIAAAVTV